MSWIELSLEATQEAIDWIRTLLATINYSESIQVTQHDMSKAGIWEFTIHFYLPYNHQTRSRITEIEQLFQPLHRTGLATEIQTMVVDEKRDPTSEVLPSHRIGSHFMVVSSEVNTVIDEDFLIPLKLPTSLTFGSGLHPTTCICIELIERYVQSAMKVLDLGCGSGILSLAMGKMGAEVLALDNSPVAIKVTQSAVELNHLTQQITVKEGSLGQGSKFGDWMGGAPLKDVPMLDPINEFDLIVANIPSHIQIALANDFRESLCPTSQARILITSGFTCDREDDIQAAFTQAGFEAIDCQRQQEWVGLAHRLVP